MFGCQCPTAKMSDNKIILSLPDAMTPVVWMMDTTDTGTFVMKVDQNDNGQYILQKISNNGQKIEDIAYYASRKKAVKAMTMITKTMDSGRCKPVSKLWCILSFIRSSIVLLASIGVLFVLAELFLDDVIDVVFGNQTVETAQQQTAPQAPPQKAPAVETDPNAVGVPMSADDFLNQKGNTGFPF